jgi:membrane protein DedA with SNARE-associated domain
MILIIVVGGPICAFAGYLLASSMGAADETMNHIVAITYGAGCFCMAVGVAIWAVRREKNKKQ